MSTTTEQRNRELLEEIFGGAAFMSPEEEYAYRSEDFEARMPQTGETFDRDSLMEMQKSMEKPPAFEVTRIAGSGDLFVVETVNTYEDDSDYHSCAIVEFADGKIQKETRYYARSMEVERGPGSESGG